MNAKEIYKGYELISEFKQHTCSLGIDWWHVYVNESTGYPLIMFIDASHLGPCSAPAIRTIVYLEDSNKPSPDKLIEQAKRWIDDRELNIRIKDKINLPDRFKLAERRLNFLIKKKLTPMIIFDFDQFSHVLPIDNKLSDGTACIYLIDEVIENMKITNYYINLISYNGVLDKDISLSIPFYLIKGIGCLESGLYFDIREGKNQDASDRYIEFHKKFHSSLDQLNDIINIIKSNKK